MIGFIIGILVGALISVFVFGLCLIAEEDRRS